LELHDRGTGSIELQYYQEPYHCCFVAVLHCLKWNNNLISWNYTTEVQVPLNYSIIKNHTIVVLWPFFISWNEITTWLVGITRQRYRFHWTFIKIHTIRISSPSMLVIHWNEIVPGLVGITQQNFTFEVLSRSVPLPSGWCYSSTEMK
jgi:hypothetical protein